MGTSKRDFPPTTMFLNRSEYDRGPNTFSPEGRLFQVEYAIEAIKLGSTAIGIQTSEGVIMAVEKRITSPLMEPTSIEKIVEIDAHIACAFSGLTADSKTLIDKARVESQNHWFTYDEKMQVESVAQAVSNLALQFDAKAIGSGSEGAQQSLQEAYHKSMTLKEATKSAFTILKQVMEEKLNETNVEASLISPEGGFRLIKGQELEDIIKELARVQLRRTSGSHLSFYVIVSGKGNIN